MFEPGQSVKTSLCQRGLTQKRLIEMLGERGIDTDKTELSSVLAGRRAGPKARMIITVSQEILQDG